MPKMKIYDVRMQAPVGNIVPLGPVSADNDARAQIEMGRLIRSRHFKTPLDQDSEVWLYDSEGAEIGVSSKIGEHLVDD